MHSTNVLPRKIPQENSMSIKDPWPCKINVWHPFSPFFSTNFWSQILRMYWGTPGLFRSSPNFTKAIQKKCYNYNKCCFRRGGVDMYEKCLAFPLNIQFRGWRCIIPPSRDNFAFHLLASCEVRKPHVPSGIWHMFDHSWPLKPNEPHCLAKS